MATCVAAATKSEKLEWLSGDGDACNKSHNIYTCNCIQKVKVRCAYKANRLEKGRRRRIAKWLSA